ncbi:MAG: TolC family protein [Acidobacteria bacterium]|nr:TolC family protein [Acidobacteriota bacterium]
MKKIIFIILALHLPFLGAQDTLKLNLEKSIDLALIKNHDLKIAHLEYQKAEELITEAFGLSVLPEIKGIVNYRRAIKRGEIILETPFFSGSFPLGSINTFTIGASLEQPLFTGAVFYATRISKVYAEISEKGYYSSQANLIKDVKRTYYAYLLAKEFKNLSIVTLKAAEDNLRNSKALFEAGLAPQYDFIRSKVQVQNILPEVEQARNSIKVAKNSLRYILGLDQEQPFIVMDSLVFTELPTEDFETSRRIMNNQNFTLQQLKLQIELQDKAVSFQFSKHFPELFLTGNWQTTAQENDRAFSRWRYINSVYVGLNLKVPIFNGFQTTSKVQQAKIDLMKAEEEFIKTDQLFKNQLDNLLLRIEETKNKISAYAATINEAQLGYDISVKSYSNGLGTQLENIDALVALTRAKINYLDAIFNYHELHANLEVLLASEVKVAIQLD